MASLMNTRTPDELSKIFKDPFRYYGGSYRLIVSPTPLAVGASNNLAYGIIPYNIDSDKALQEIFIKMSDIVNSKVDMFNDIVKKIKHNIRADYAGKTLVGEDIMRNRFPKNYSCGLLVWTHGKDDDIMKSCDDEATMLIQIKVMQKLNENFRFMCFKKDKEDCLCEYFPDIYG